MAGQSLLKAPELLSPAGSPEKLQYAIAYGADAVYLGLPMASLRTPNRGQTFTPSNLGQWVHYAQAQGVKVYVTINIFANNRDLDRIIPHLEQLETLRPDGIIFSDLGVFRLAQKYAPSVPLHLSTQANTLNREACALWQDLGLQRVILAREVPVREMAEIHEALPDLELEAFVHGSLCVAYSGRCLISDYLTENTKNSNKGMCGNSCRWEFESSQGESTAGKTSDESHGCQGEPDLLAPTEDEVPLTNLEMREVTRPNDVYTFEEDERGTYMLNSRDLCLVGYLKDLQDAGVVSFKIEGRTKSVYYAATTTRIYRQAIDWFQQHDSASEAQVAEWVYELSMAGNRGFTEGFIHGRPNHLAYNYQDSDSHQGAAFIATAKAEAVMANQMAHPGYNGLDPNGWLWIQARNPFQTGDSIDWITPSQSQHVTVGPLFDKHGFPIDTAQTNQVVAMACPPSLAQDPGLAWSILRRQERVVVPA